MRPSRRRCIASPSATCCPGRTPALALTAAFVVVSQLKINVMNAYAGSLAWSNFFSRLTHSHPGRVVWLVFNVAIALLLMELGIYQALEQTLGLFAVVAVAWLGAIVADLAINKPLGLSPPGIEFKRAHLYDINPVGVGAMGLAAARRAPRRCGPVRRRSLQALAPFVALGVALVAAPPIAALTKGRYYLARKPRASWKHLRAKSAAASASSSFEPEDMAYCPAYADADLLALLLARCPLPRSLQAEGAAAGAADRRARRGAAQRRLRRGSSPRIVQLSRHLRVCSRR